jgi:NADH-quinone oxidoreductase subunit C
MAEHATSLVDRLRLRLDTRLSQLIEANREITIEVPTEQWVETARILRDDPEFAFDTAVDLCGVDYLGYGRGEWDTEGVSNEGFSRGVEGDGAPGRFQWADRPHPPSLPKRFAAVVHLLSTVHNRRLRMRCFCAEEPVPVVPTLTDLWPGLNWFEREAFDLFGIVFEGHPDLRRILTDYGFVGHPFRKDFPLIGNVEVRYDPELGRVVYEPVSIEPRVLVPRVIREDSRYQQARAEQGK